MINKIYEKIKKFIKNNFLFILSIVIILFMFYYETPYIIYRPGGTIDLNKRVEVNLKYTEKGKIYMSYVTAMKGAPAFIILSYILPDWDLYKISDVSDEDSYDKTLEVGKIYLNEGIDNAIISAFNESDYNINITKEILDVIYISDNADTDIEVGDTIIKINDKHINSFKDVREYINTLKEKEKVKVLVNNNGKEIERKAVVYRDEDNLLKIGIAFHTTYEYETEVPVKIKMENNESGSSGSFMMALKVYNALTKEDITKGLKIVGTGSIDANGNIEEIGGVKYKVLGSERIKADVFFCPEENYEEAMDIKNKRNLKINIVKVSNLKDAIKYLEGI